MADFRFRPGPSSPSDHDVAGPRTIRAAKRRGGVVHQRPSANGLDGSRRVAWLLALGRLTVVGFFAIFTFLAARAAIRKTGGGDEALAIALVIGSVISFASMWMASQVGETAALKLHATELLMLLGTAIVMLVERPAQPRTSESRTSETLTLEQAQLRYNR